MTEFINHVFDEEKPWLSVDDTWENIISDLKTYTLDPRFVNFIDRNPNWTNEETINRYRGCTRIFGNFLSYSHAFYVVTDDEKMILQIEALVEENMGRKEYVAAKKNFK